MAKLARHDENAILIRAPEPALKAAIATTRSVPLVIVAVSYDPLASGYINSLAHPGGNVTGVFLENVELAAKRIDLLKQAAPKTARLVVLYDAAGKYQLDPLQSAASVLGLSLDAVELRDTPYDPTFPGLPTPSDLNPPSLEVPPQPNSITSASVRGRTVGLLDCSHRGARTRRVAFIKAHFCRRGSSHLTRSPDHAGHAGAGGARSRAMSDRISWNICRGTATSAIWNVT
jgi:ABC transporter substrate binding protein